MERNVANDVAEVLKACGVREFFMLTGGDQPLWIALKENGIRMVVGRSEASAVYMADGYARASGGPAVVYGQAGPGAANVAAALADAWWAQSPVMALTGATATGLRHSNEYQDLNQYAMFEPVTKWNGRAENPAQVPALIRKALQMTVMETPGPTHVDIPKDYFGKPSPATGNAFSSLPLIAAHAEPDEKILIRMAETLASAQKPVILAGEGVRFAEAWHELAAFSTAAGIPIIVTMGGKPAGLSSHPNFIGVAGRYSAVTANGILADADAVLVLGSRLGGLATSGYTLPARTAAIMQIDCDATAFVNQYFPDMCVLSDLRIALDRLGRLIESRPIAPDWLARCREATTAWRTEVARTTDLPGRDGAVSPMSVLASLTRVADDITLVADTGYMAAWTGVLYPTTRYNCFFRATGSLGWALPASLGVQMARGGKTVCVTGDGGAGYHLADIETAVRYRLPVIIMVLNNNCLAFEYHEQKYRWDGRVIEEANNFCPIHFANAAEALGARGRRVGDRSQVDAALDEAMRHDGPTVIEVMTDPEAYPPVTNFEKHMERKI